MKFIKCLLLVFLFVYVTSALTADVKNGYIGDCYLTNSESYVRPRTVTFICVEDFRQINLFNESAMSSCNSSNSFQKRQINQINFENCTMSNIVNPIFEVYDNVIILNATYLGLEALQKELFREAENLTILNVSHNEIVELSSFLFINAAKLEEADFSFNAINRLDAFTFAGDSKLERLNLAQNNITNLHKQFFDYLLNLKQLNLSHNNINALAEHLFDNLTNLEFLDLSHNVVDELNVNIFTSLKKLLHLNISHAKLSEIKSKTFCHLNKLEILDLSHNNLKVLDVRALDEGIFLPRFEHLKLLDIGGNRLMELKGFSSSRFPVMKFHGIAENDFECCYLMKLFRTIGWQQLDVPFDKHSNHPNISDSNGVKCNFGNDFIYDAETTHFTWAEVLTMICALLLTVLFTLVFLIMKQNRNTNQNFRQNHGAENLTVQCDSISTLNHNVYDLPKF